MIKNFFKSKKIFLLLLIVPITRYVTGPSSCGTYMRPEPCESVLQFLNAMIFDIELQNLFTVGSFTVLFLLLLSVFLFLRRKK